MRNQVFISYRQETPQHAQAVRRLGELLRQAGLAVALDQFLLEDQPGGPDQGWPKWCEDCARDCACVLVIASAGWFTAYEASGPRGSGRGSAAEARLLRQYLYDEPGRNARIRLVLLDDLDPEAVPAGLRAWHRFRPFASDTERGQLVRWAAQCLAAPVAPDPNPAPATPNAATPSTPSTARPAMDAAAWERQRSPLRDLLVALPDWDLLAVRRGFVAAALGEHPAARLTWEGDGFTVAGELVSKLKYYSAAPLPDVRHAVCALLAEARTRKWDQAPAIGDAVRRLAAAFGCELNADAAGAGNGIE
ncbi:TIR domain-containing protein [Candidatus Thiodictyon syntrophicum]|jgi:hypothetical protein|uniref:SEFIR domain-containing protein n=1 Tax=Candidatus Thiodictyon syntrophicum TaxID=1166950 RepID=A0A2K8U8I9_9GAMM|nr:TIR domain-containing protein [Candidatus Thiodictyon syntrophicum]AUB81896.1 hypothetical protein THSYN_13640 [Candidatus Thiodictyon syntrophicum]